MFDFILLFLYLLLLLYIGVFVFYIGPFVFINFILLFHHFLFLLFIVAFYYAPEGTSGGILKSHRPSVTNRVSGSYAQGQGRNQVRGQNRSQQ